MHRYIDLELDNLGDPSQDEDPTLCPRCGHYCDCPADLEALHVVEQMRLSLEPYRDDREAA